MNLRHAAGIMLVVLGVAGCGLATDAEPRDLPADENNLIPDQVVIGGEAEGPDRIYLGAPGDDRLRSVPRDASSTGDLLEILFAGPNDDELAQQYSTFLPPSLELQRTLKQGPILLLDVSQELTELSGESLTRALAQIVYTATELDGVERVQIRVDGQTVSWPRSIGTNTSAALSVYDYPGLVQTAQPAFPALPARA